MPSKYSSKRMTRWMRARELELPVEQQQALRAARRMARSEASKKGWRSRKRMQEARKAKP